MKEKLPEHSLFCVFFFSLVESTEGKVYLVFRVKIYVNDELAFRISDLEQSTSSSTIQYGEVCGIILFT